MSRLTNLTNQRYSFMNSNISGFPVQSEYINLTVPLITDQAGFVKLISAQGLQKDHNIYICSF
jgi:hypothetical protein